jgi:hypothetical protein
VQVPRCCWRSKALDEAPYKLSGAVAKLASITFWSLAFPGLTNLGFLLREKLAAVLIIPSSWGSQLDGDLHHQHRAASRLFSGTVAGEKKTSARGVSHAHPLLCFKFCFTLFLLASFYQKHTKN